MRVENCLRLVVWNNWREDRFEHDRFMKKGAIFVSRCQVQGFRIYKMFKQPVAHPSGHIENKLDAELYAVTPECLWWCDEQVTDGFDRMNVIAHMFAKDEPREPHLPKKIDGHQCAWLHFYTRPMPDHAVVMGCVRDFPDYSQSQYEVIMPGAL